MQTHNSCNCHLHFIDVLHTFCIQILITMLSNKTQELRLLLQIKLIRRSEQTKLLLTTNIWHCDRWVKRLINK